MEMAIATVWQAVPQLLQKWLTSCYQLRFSWFLTHIFWYRFFLPPDFSTLSRHWEKSHTCWNRHPEYSMKCVLLKYGHSSQQIYQKINFFTRIFPGFNNNLIIVLLHLASKTLISITIIGDISLLTLSWQRPLSYRNQSIDLLCKSMDWSLYDNGFRHERVKRTLLL